MALGVAVKQDIFTAQAQRQFVAFHNIRRIGLGGAMPLGCAAHIDEPAKTGPFHRKGQAAGLAQEIVARIGIHPAAGFLREVIDRNIEQGFDEVGHGQPWVMAPPDCAIRVSKP